MSKYIHNITKVKIKIAVTKTLKVPTDTVTEQYLQLQILSSITGHVQSFM